jgi:hypothetical protein
MVTSDVIKYAAILFVLLLAAHNMSTRTTVDAAT